MYQSGYCITKISYDPKDADKGLTGDRAQGIGLEYAAKYFPVRNAHTPDEYRKILYSNLLNYIVLSDMTGYNSIRSGGGSYGCIEKRRDLYYG